MGGAALVLWIGLLGAAPFIQTSAQSGAQAKLMHSAGMIAGIGACQDTPPSFEYVDVNVWKGNLPKSVVQDRITALYNKHDIAFKPYTKDEWDAVGIGLHLKGFF